MSFKKTAVICMIMLCCGGFNKKILAQVGIGTATPNQSAALDLTNTSKGLLVPRMTAAQRVAIGLPSKALLVYQTDDTEGFYYNAGTPGLPNWVSILSSESIVSGWNLNGNTGTVSGTNFIGTADPQSLDFRTNNILRTRITTKGQIEVFNTGESIFIGELAGSNDDLSSNRNVFIGYQAGATNTSGDRNSVVGYNALNNNSTGSDNVAIGYLALGNNTTGNDNTAVGNNALASLGGTQTGIRNTAVGFHALYFNTSGEYNVAIGYEAMSNSSTSGNTTGSYNIAIGNSALDNNETGSYNTGIGNNVDVDDANRTNTIVLGGNGNLSLGGDNRVRIGNSSMSSIGGQVGWTTISDERVKTNLSEGVKGLGFIMRLRPLVYNYNVRESNKVQGNNDDTDWKGKYAIEKIRFSGFLAQEVEKAAIQSGYSFSGVDKPESPNGLWGLRYAEFVVPIVKAMQEQQQIIDILQKDNKLLLEQLKDIKKEIELLRQTKQNAGKTLN